MNELVEWSKLFTKSSFFSIKKEEDLSSELEILKSKLKISENVLSFHPARQKEYILGRLCASKAHELCTSTSLLELNTSTDRSPIWPQNIVGSIAHDRKFVGAAVANKNELLGLGIDFEELGRAKIELSSHLRSSEDIKSHPDFTDEELLTIIFSTKESLYKALYPNVKQFFGFEDAALRSIDKTNGLFQIDLLHDLNLNFGPRSRYSFQGRFTVANKTCLTVLEVEHK